MDVDDVSCPGARRRDRGSVGERRERESVRESTEKMRKIKMRKGKMKSIKKEIESLSSHL